MKGIDKLLTVLNQLLDDKLTAINQYIAHSGMCNSWGYTNTTSGDREACEGRDALRPAAYPAHHFPGRHAGRLET